MTVHLIVTTKKWLCHTEHIRNESLESLEMDTTLNYQTFQNPELWSAGPLHELHQSRKESGWGLRLGLCGVQRESTLGSKIILGFQTCAYLILYINSLRPSVCDGARVRHRQTTGPARHSRTRARRRRAGPGPSLIGGPELLHRRAHYVCDGGRGSVYEFLWQVWIPGSKVKVPRLSNNTAIQKASTIR